MKFYALIIALIVIIILIWINAIPVAGFVFGKGNFKHDIDPFSAIGVMFSGLGLIGVVIAIFIQQTELKLQRKELQETREIFETERFEITFFNLLNSHRQIISQIKYDFVNKANIKENGQWVDKEFAVRAYGGIEFFKQLFNDLTVLYEMANEIVRADGISYVSSKARYVFVFSRYKDVNPWWLLRQLENPRRNLSEVDYEKLVLRIIFEAVFKEHRDTLSFYFNNIIQSLTFIGDFENRIQQNYQYDTDFQMIVKAHKYVNMLKSQITPPENSLLFYHITQNSTVEPIFKSLNYFDDIGSLNLLSPKHSIMFKI